MIRINDKHKNHILNKLKAEKDKIRKMKKYVIKHIQWHELPHDLEGRNICAVDGSRQDARLCGGILTAISANAIGKNLDMGVFEMNLFTDSYYISDRIRRLMMTMEYRTAAMVGGEVDLVLMDGTLSGAIIMPSLLSSFNNPLNIHPKEAKELGRLFIKSLNEFLGEMMEHTESNIHKNTLLSSKVFYDFDDDSMYVQEVREYISSNDIFKCMDNTTHWEIFLEHIEMIHALNNLLEWDCAFISKTHYEKSISNILKENEAIIEKTLNSSVINSIFHNSGYTITKYDGDGRLHINKIFETFKEEFPQLKVVRDNPSKNIIQSYCRFVNGGILLGLEVPTTNKKSLEEVISLLSPYSKLGYPIYLRDAHRRAVISKKEMDTYVYSLMKSIGEHDEELGVFFQNGRSVL